MMSEMTKKDTKTKNRKSSEEPRIEYLELHRKLGLTVPVDELIKAAIGSILVNGNCRANEWFYEHAVDLINEVKPYLKHMILAAFIRSTKSRLPSKDLIYNLCCVLQSYFSVDGRIKHLSRFVNEYRNNLPNSAPKSAITLVGLAAVLEKEALDQNIIKKDVRSKMFYLNKNTQMVGV